ncbi:MAG: helix-turn-helix domain-containing protein [Mycobacteriales bacterium]
MSTRASRPHRPSPAPAGGGGGEPDRKWQQDIAAAAAVDAAAPASLLGDYLELLTDAAIHGGRPSDEQLVAVAAYGRRAALAGVPPGTAVNLYLSAAWRLWRGLPEVVRSEDSEGVRQAADAVLQVVSQAVAVFVDGYQDERRESIRREESLRREFIDDLLRGDADVAGLVERAEPFGLDLSQPHQVALALPAEEGRGSDALAPSLERVVVQAFGDRDVLVATKEAYLVVLVPVDSARTPEAGVGAIVSHEVHRGRAPGSWRVGVGRAHPGAYGIARSYEEAREALDLGRRLHLASPVVEAKDVLVYRVLGRDQTAMMDLVRAVLEPLRLARGGPDPLLDTLEAYFACGGVSTEAARRLHLSVRAVTYRLDRVHALTGHDVNVPEQAFSLQAAVRGARLLNWPRSPLPA